MGFGKQVTRGFQTFVGAHARNRYLTDNIVRIEVQNLAK